jgi:glycosyltransferase involved in cell wall biosynthesis
MPHAQPSATIVIPAHNEVSGLGRLLPLLLGSAAPGEFRVIVVCNGCSDGSAAEARRHGSDVEVVELAQPSKAAALAAGGALVRAYPVAFVDADVALDTESVRGLVALLGRPGLLAAAPTRRLERGRVSRPAGWYYDIWERLPGVRAGLFGRGVIVLSEAGFRRVSALPQFVSDDLAFSEAFQPGERGISEDSVVSVWPARTWRSLVLRRVRVVQGNRELHEAGRVSESASTSVGDLLGIVRAEPRMATRLPVFLVTTILSRLLERRMRGSRTSTWMRDETSRAT